MGLADRVGQITRAVAVAALLWLVLAEGAAGGLLGVASVAAAAAAAVALGAPRSRRRRPLAAVRLAGFFLVHSLLGALDVGYRALHPRLPLQRAWLHHPLRLPDGEPRQLLVAAVSLLPGALAADLDGDTLIVHAILPGAEGELRALEARLARVYGIEGEPAA